VRAHGRVRLSALAPRRSPGHRLSSLSSQACWKPNRPYNEGVHRLFTPLLRRVYRLFGVFVVIYLFSLSFQYSSWNKERLYRKLIAGDQSQIASAGFDLAYLNGEAQLLRALKIGSPAVRTVAMNGLWDLWARAGGHHAFREIQAANQALQRKAYSEALQILTRLTRQYPDFPEGWNRRATVYWQMGRFDESIADAKRTVALNPNHFGAWQGLGLCEVHLGDLEEACRCIRVALRITPHDRELRTLLIRCEALLNRLSPGEKVHYDLI
jgi:tetratricopeptide (TPR) repeat protein